MCAYMSVHVCICACVWGVAACLSDKAYGADPVLPGQSHIQIRGDNIHWKNCCRLDTALYITHNTVCVFYGSCICVCVCLCRHIGL